MNPAWIALAIAGAGVVALAYAAPRAKAAEPERPRVHGWQLEVCGDDDCRLVGKVLSGPTACAVDLNSYRIVKTGVRLSCVRIDGGKR